MGLLSLFKNNMQKQEIPEDADSGEFHSRAEQESKPVRANGKRTTPNRKAKVVDPILPEKKRARRRLIGAVALVLAAVIGLPMVLDSEPKPNADEISVQIPSKDKAPALVGHSGVEQVVDPAAVVRKNKLLETDPVEEVIAPAIKTSSDAPIKSVSPTAQS
jgi:DedD protein